MISTLLVANRGEIARRITHTCRRLGVSTVAVHADPDADAAHVAEADAAVRLPGTALADTYLRVDALVGAALTAGADAVHPGYGFLAENAEFARAVIDAGLIWVGPAPDTMTAMAAKTEAKRIMAEAGVPVLDAVDPAAVPEGSWPLLVKAVAGGGGRGMRVVRTPDALPDALAAAGAEAEAAFGDPRVFCEPYVERARHVEVQILADTHGTVWALGERDCSLQRRHQKVLEETPAPGLSDEVRRRLHRAAVTAARATDYTGAGTVEFLLAPDGRFSFLEMNTRLQVEHPVTECVTGVDLVELQLLVAEGHALPPAPPAPRGCAVEVRLYAEDPARDWRPSPGVLHRLDVPGVTARFACAPGGTAAAGPDGLRLDAGVTDGETVGVSYDPLLAKVIAWAPTRDAAARRLAHALARARVHGPTTNRELLVRALRHPEFLAGRVDTGFLDRHHGTLTSRPAAEQEAERLSALAAALADAAANRAAAPVLGTLPGGWRNVPSAPAHKRYRSAATEHEVRYRLTRAGLAAEDHPSVRLLDLAPHRVVLESAGVRRAFEVTVHGEQVYVESSLGAVALTALPRFPDPEPPTTPGSLLAPMPGTVARVAAAPGDRVTAGQPLLWLEAMKMQHQINAPATGTVTEVLVRTGQQVDLGAPLAVVTPRDTAATPPPRGAAQDPATTAPRVPSPGHDRPAPPAEHSRAAHQEADT
ncbi:ATP-binding protein [Wenjunlia vitaminophila]|uniref:ATP-binding protein n=1 Tax=Wenjunlia vitaminophila TaxID=76728 RepID=UPI000996DAEC|nr:biotin carboxylase N-terminal domain-containing protein [Wenjunlia vitaminophila]